MFNHLFFDEPVCLGDAFVMNAIVHHYASECTKLYYPVKDHFYDTLSCLYKECNNIEIYRWQNHDIRDEFVRANNISLIKSLPLDTTVLHRVNCELEHIHIHWPQQIYDNFNILFSRRYTDFKMPSNIEGQDELYDKLTGGEKEYILLHRFSGTNLNGIEIDVNGFREIYKLGPPIKIIEIIEGTTTNMLQYKRLIENATEIHCIPSSFFNLVDSMIPEVNGNLFFHDIRRNSIMRVNSRWNKHLWNVVSYGARF